MKRREFTVSIGAAAVAIAAKPSFAQDPNVIWGLTVDPMSLFDRRVYPRMDSFLAEVPDIEDYESFRVWTLVDRIEKAGVTRNALAHGEVTAKKAGGSREGYTVAVLPFSHTEPYRAAAAKHLRPMGRASKRAIYGPSRLIDLNEIKNLTVECENLRKELRDFAGQIEILLSE